MEREGKMFENFPGNEEGEAREKKNKEEERGNANNNVSRKLSLLTHLRFFVKGIIIVRFGLIGLLDTEENLTLVLLSKYKTYSF